MSQAKDNAVRTLLGRLAPAPWPAEPPAPMLCTLVAAPLPGDDWLYEPKLDGLRVLCFCRPGSGQGDITLLSRNGKPQNFQFPDIAAALRQAITRPAILDGEIVCLDEHGRSSFRQLQQRFHLLDAAEVARRAADHPAYLYAFDLLYFDRFDLRPLPLRDRKRLLRAACAWGGRLRLLEGVSGDGHRILHDACAKAEEGIVGKRLDALYFGGRSESWVKIKCIGRQEFVIGGFTDLQRSRVGLGALLVGFYEQGRLRYAGKVGTGYTREVLMDLRRRLDPLEQRENPFDDQGGPHGPGVHWVAPRLVAEIAFAEWTQNGLLRQPRFEGLREDKPAREVKRERPVLTGAARKNVQLPSSESRVPSPRSPTMPLEEYREKRDFHITSEPSPKVGRTKSGPVFVIQEHHATRLHWDFRLEHAGVLKSWAVTNEPVMDPKIKRLAVQVEDHPLAYAKFHGDIPEGQYGAGHVEIWDSGTFEPEGDFDRGLESGKVTFTLHGQKLRGKFALIRAKFGGKKKNWLLLKMKDDQAARQGTNSSPAASKAGSASNSRKRPAARGSKRPGSGSPAASAAQVVADGTPQRVAWTNTDKVMFPEARITKGDILRFYEQVAPALLPHLRDRPITLERLPNGLSGDDAPHFWQKNTPAHYPAWIPRAVLPAEKRSGAAEKVHYLLINDLDALLYVVNQGALTFHVFFSRVGSLDRPDFVLFDIDPHQSTFPAAVQVAKTLRTILQEGDVEAFVKTSGKSGLHVLVPWEESGGYDAARAWALDIAEEVVRAIPEVATTERRIDQRRGRVYLDVMQNARGHHAVPPYVLRPVPAATVSTPLAWSELTPKLDPSRFTMAEVLRRLKRKPDPMSPLR